MTDDKATPAPGDEPEKKPAKKPAAKKKAPAKAKAEPAAPDEGEKKPAAKKKAAPKKKAASKAKEPAEGEATATTKKKAAPKKKAPARGRKRPAADDGEPEEPIAEGEAGSGSGPALVIVESPAKAKTINKYLGKGYLVKASFGHVRDLPTKGKDLGIDVEHGFQPRYEPLEEKRKVVNDLKRSAKNASAIYLATDNDREGEAIAWHIQELLRAKKENTRRVTFNEITKTAIQKAFESPRSLDMAKVNAQQARRILDRIVGYKLSPLLWEKLRNRNLSAGRVQSVAVKLVVEREREIQAFRAIEYWDLESTLAKLDAPPAPPPAPEPAPAPEGAEGAAKKAPAVRSLGPGRFFAHLVKIGDETLAPEKFRIQNEAEATALREELLRTPFTVSLVKKTERTSNPSPPFITSSLQTTASSALGFSPNRAMRIAQGLYEGVELGEEGSVGLITYMRTDSFNLAKDAVDEVREFIRSSYGPSYLPGEPVFHRKKKEAVAAQEAHEAIRPTSALRTPEKVAKFLTDEQLKLYTLIWRRFVACQMLPALFSQTTVEVKAGRALFRASGRTLIFDGYQRVTGTDKKEEAVLPDVSENEVLSCEKLQASQHFTQPPPRFNEASLVKALEDLGIGRPSTYAAIIGTIQDPRRAYVEQRNKRLHATKLGMVVTDRLQKHFEKIMDTAFTRKMEEDLDQIEEEKVDWVAVLSEFNGPFERELAKAASSMKPINETPEESTIACKKCGRLMVYKYNTKTFERFLACPGYNTEDKCDATMPVDDETGAPQIPEETEETCPECGSSMVIKMGKNGRFLACSAYPNCKVTRELADEGGGILGASLERECELCGKMMKVRRGFRGQFLGCSGYPECRNTRPIVMQDGKQVEGQKRETVPLPEVDVKCPKCGAQMKVKLSRRGPFLGCSKFPKCRGTAQVPDDVKEKLPKPAPPKELGENCELCGKPLLIKAGRRGEFVGCSGYPTCRNTRPMPAAT